MTAFLWNTMRLKQKYSGTTQCKMPLTSSAIIKSTTMRGWGCNRGPISTIKRQQANLLYSFFFQQNNWLTTFTFSLLRQHCVRLMTHIHTSRCQLASRRLWRAQPWMREEVDHFKPHSSPQSAVSSQQSQTGPGKGRPARHPIETQAEAVSGL